MFMWMSNYIQIFTDNNLYLWYGSFFFVFLSLFVFWKESIGIYTHKNKNAIFDFWLISALSGVIGGRVVYFIANWEVLNLKNIPWFWSPYEKINNSIYVFRLYPWRFFRFWDGGFIFAGMLVGYIAAVYLLILKKKGWKWNAMFVPAFNSAVILFGGLLLMIGLYTNTEKVVIANAAMLALLLLFTILRKLVYFFVQALDLRILITKIMYSLIVLAVNGIMVYLYFYSNVKVLLLEKISILTFAGLSLIMVIHYILEKDPRIEQKEKRKGIVNIELNKPIRLA